jgi:DNA-binding ferritin-like protein
MGRIEELLSYYVAFLRSVYLIHQNSHWIAKGSNFYGNHLLFERIYKSAADDADLAAEKFIGLFGNETLDPMLQAKLIGKILEQFSSLDPLKMSLEVEKKFLVLSEKVYNQLEDARKLSLGLDDMIMSIANDREAAIYLLQQAMKSGNKNEKMAARKNALMKLKGKSQ